MPGWVLAIILSIPVILLIWFYATDNELPRAIFCVIAGLMMLILTICAADSSAVLIGGIGESLAFFTFAFLSFNDIYCFIPSRYELREKKVLRIMRAEHKRSGSDVKFDSMLAWVKKKYDIQKMYNVMKEDRSKQVIIDIVDEAIDKYKKKFYE